MSWTTPTIRATGYLVTASDWNTDLVDNLAYLKGQAGQVTLEDDLIPNSSTLTIGEAANPWNLGVFNSLYSRRYAVHQAVRTIILPWSEATVTQDVDIVENGGGTHDEGGTGQIVLKVDDDGAGHAYIANLAAQNNAKDTSFNASRSPYGRFEFSIDESVANALVFIGFRQTVASGIPSSQNYFGLDFNGSNWNVASSNGSNIEANTVTVSDNVRHVIEMVCISATQVEFYLDGTLEETFTSYLPTGDLEWQVMLESVGTGGATDTYLTCGLVILQEDLGG